MQRGRVFIPFWPAVDRSRPAGHVMRLFIVNKQTGGQAPMAGQAVDASLLRAWPSHWHPLVGLRFRLCRSHLLSSNARLRCAAHQRLTRYLAPHVGTFPPPFERAGLDRESHFGNEALVCFGGRPYWDIYRDAESARRFVSLAAYSEIYFSVCTQRRSRGARTSDTLVSEVSGTDGKICRSSACREHFVACRPAQAPRQRPL